MTASHEASHERMARMRQPEGVSQLHRAPKFLESLREEDVHDMRIEPMSLTPPSSGKTTPTLQPRTVDFDGLCVPGKSSET